MTTNVATIVISNKSLLADGVIMTLEKGGYNVVQHVVSASDVEFVQLRDRKDLLFVLVQEQSVNQAAPCLKLRKELPQSRIILMTGDHESVRALTDVMPAEADASISGAFNTGELLNVLQLVLSTSNRFVMTRSVEARIETKTTVCQTYRRSLVRDVTIPLNRLSRRELEILGAVAEGNSNKDLANLFDLSEATVKAHVRSIFSKLGTRNRTSAALQLLSANGGR